MVQAGGINLDNQYPFANEYKESSSPSNQKYESKKICISVYNRYYLSFILMRISKTPVVQKVQQKNEHSQTLQHFKLVSICLKNVFQGILKRLQGQVFCKMIANSARHNQKKSNLKFISYFSNSFLRRKKQASFDKLKRFQHLSLLKHKAVILLAFYCRRTVKHELKHIWHRLSIPKIQVKSIVRRKSSRKSAGELPSPRISEESQKSNILAISQDSLSEKHEEQYQDRRQYGSNNPKNLFIQSQQSRKMDLSHHFREVLHKMDGLDVFKDAEAIVNALNDPTVQEQKRLQKIRRQHKSPKNKLHDNQLTLGCILNQIKFLQQQAITQQLSFQTQVKSSDYLTSQELTTLNMITAVIRARQYKDIKRQIDYFVKKTSKKQLVPLLRQVLAAFESFSNIDEANKSKDKNKQNLNNMVCLLDKHLRAEKYEEIEKLKNKVKNSADHYQFSALLQTIVANNNELKKHKKPDSMSVDRTLRSPANQRSVYEQNESLKQELKALQMKLRDLEGEHQKLKDAMKKNVERVHPSLLPKKNTDKQPPGTPNTKNEDSMKKYKQLEVNMQKKLESLSKQTGARIQKAKQDERKLQEKIKQLEFQLENSQNHSKSVAAKLKQKQDFLQMYQTITKKMLQKENYIRDINEFKKRYAQSRFMEIIERITTEQNSRNTLLNQLKNIISSFEDNSWKRKQNNLLLKTQGELYESVNMLIEKNLTLLRQKQEGKSLQKQIQIVRKNEQKLLTENMSLKEQVSALKKEIKQATDQIAILNREKQSKSQLQSNPKNKSPQKIFRSSVDKQVADLRVQNSKLKAQLQNKASSFQQSTQNGEPYKVQLQQGEKFYELIKAKKNKNQSFIKDINQFKRSYPKSLFNQIFETITKEETAKLQLLNQIKNVVSWFSDGSWKKRQIALLLKQQTDLNLQINSLINLLLNLNKMADESKYINLANQLKNIKAMFSDSTWKRRQNALIIKDQSQLHTSVNQLVQFTIGLLSQKEELSKSKIELEQLKEKVSELEIEVKNVREEKKRQRVEESNRQLLSERNQRIRIEIELKHYISQNQQIKKRLQENQAQRSQFELALSSHVVKQKQLQDLLKLYQTIKSKKLLGQSSIKQVNQYKKTYQNSLSLELVDVLYSNIIEQYNKATKQIPSRKNTQMVAAQQKHRDQTKELEMQKLRDENTRLKSEFKTRPQSPETKEKLNVERQKTLTQMREINELKLEIDRYKVEINKYKEQLQNASETNNLANTQLNRIQLQLQSTLKQNAAEKEKQSSHLAQSLHRKQKQQQQLKFDMQRRQNSYIGQLKEYQQKVQTLEVSLQQSESMVNQLQLKNENYKLLYQKIKQERNNLILLLQQKNQQFQITKQNQELYYKQRDQKQGKIIELKHRFEETEVDIKQIQTQIQKVLAEKASILGKCTQDLQTKEREISELKSTLDQKQKLLVDLNKRNELELISLRSTIQGKENERFLLQRQLDLQNQEIQFLKQRMNTQVIDLRLKCEQLTRELKLMQDQKNQYLSLIEEKSHIPFNSFPEDHQKIELRKQLELVNQQMATFVRNSQYQKRQMRQYMQKLSNEMQMQNVLHNQQKKMLKEDIQRAKNEQYQINLEKLSRLRADIKGLRVQNERLTSIIDHNEESFHQLIEQHKQMSIKIEHLQEFNQTLSQQNSQLTSDMYKAGQQKLELALKLQPLEEKLAQLQTQIAVALQEKKLSEIQMFRSSQAKQNSFQLTINNLTHENGILQTKLSNQGKSLLQLYQSNLRLQSQLARQKQIAAQEANCKQPGEYSKYLQQKINEQNESIKRLSANQDKLVQKIEMLMNNIGQLEKERVQLHSQKRQRDFQMSKQADSKSIEVVWLEKCAYLQQMVVQKQKEISFWKANKSQPSTQTQQLQAKIRQLQQFVTLYENESLKLKKLHQQKNKQSIELQLKSDQNLKLNIQIKHLGSKIKILNEDLSQIQQKYSRSQNEVIQLRKQKAILLQNYSTDNRFQHLRGSSMTKQKQQEIGWLKNQLSLKDAELLKIRIVQHDLAHKINLCNQRLAHYEHLEVIYNTELKSHSETKRQIDEIQIFHQNQIQALRDSERSALENLQKANSRIQQLQRQNLALSSENRQVSQAKQAKRMYNFSLRELVLQLDQNFNFQSSDQQLQIRILQKISQQISQLLFENNKLKQKCTQIQNSIYSKNWQEPKQQTISLLQKLTEDILSYLRHQELINPEDLNMNIQYLLKQPTSNSEVYLQNLAIFIKNVIASINKDSLQLLMLYNQKIDRIKTSFDVHMHNNNLDSFKQLKTAIYANLQQ